MAILRSTAQTFSAVQLLCVALVIFFANEQVRGATTTRHSYPTAQTPTIIHSKNGLVLDSNLKNIYPVLSRNLKITCSFNISQANGTNSLISLVLSKWNVETVEEVLTLDTFASDKVKVLKDLGGTVSGVYSSTAVSFLSLEWRYPSQDESGRYSCEANIMSNFGHSSTTQVEIDIVPKPIGMASLVIALRTLMLERDALLDRFESLRTILFDTTKHTVDGVQFYWSKITVANNYIQQSMCNSIGGTLAEFNTDQLAKAKTILQTPMPKANFMIGLIKVSNKWIYPSTGIEDISPAWSSGEPNTAAYACAYLSGSTWLYYDHPCTTAITFLCSVKAK